MNPEYVGSHPAPRSAHPHAGLAVRTTTILWSWLTTTDHKRIGILYGVSAFVFFLIGGVEALIIRAQLARPGLTLVTADTYNELFTMHGTTMVFLAIMPFGSAFFNYMVPLQIGARDVAFPRLNALSFWMFLAGGILLHTSFLAGTPPAVGWFAYANLTRREYSPNLGVDFWTLSLQVLGASSILAAVNFIVTILNVRAPGLSFMRMPLFTWMTLVVQFLVLLAFPPITCALIFLMFDRFFGTHFYDVAEGGDLHLWQHLFWTFGHPEVYILILPAFGIVSEVLPTFARKPLFGAPVVIYSGVLIGFFGFGVWGHHMFAAGMGPVADSAFAIATMLIAIPTGVKIFNWLATLWGGRIHGTTALHFAAGLLATVTIGAPGDPWDGRTLEWRTSSPPPAHNFDAIPPVYGRDSFWREKHGPQRTPLAPPVAEHGIHLPAPSHWPIVLACGVFVAAVGALVHLAWVILGGLLALWAAISFALEHHRNPAHEHQVGVLGIDHRKVGIWTFIGSECLFFGTLIATYIAYKGRSIVGPHPHEILNIPITSASTFDLLMSSLLMVLALAAAQRGDRRQSRLWLAGTAFFGLIFLGFQAYEFTSFVHEGLTLQQNLFGSTFFVLTGFHGAPVALGVLWLVTLLVLDLPARLGVAVSVKVEIAGLYWHFVDIVWIVIFTLVYLVP